jgi:hypothetical protein
VAQRLCPRWDAGRGGHHYSGEPSPELRPSDCRIGGRYSFLATFASISWTQAAGICEEQRWRWVPGFLPLFTAANSLCSQLIWTKLWIGFEFYSPLAKRSQPKTVTPRGAIVGGSYTSSLRGARGSLRRRRCWHPGPTTQRGGWRYGPTWRQVSATWREAGAGPTCREPLVADVRVMGVVRVAKWSWAARDIGPRKVFWPWEASRFYLFLFWFLFLVLSQFQIQKSNLIQSSRFPRLNAPANKTPTWCA